MTSISHSNNLCLVTLPCPSSTPPSLSAASPSSPSSTGWTDKITKKIQELNDHEKNLKNLKIAKNGYLPEKDSKSLDSLPTQLASLETVHKLAEFADQLDTKNNPSNNILNNLCTGLETFLGFNSETKGYTGQGIVYSDLDRLCDAVMGFLSGVLGAVKDENEVTTYDNKDGNDINKLISDLNNKIGSGRAGLVDAVDAVKGWLEGYEGEIKKKTEAIKKPINLIKEQIELDKHEIGKEKDFTDLTKQIADWTHRAQWYIDRVTDAEIAMKNIDTTLSGKLKCNISLLLQATGSFKEAARVEDLKDMYEMARTKLSAVSNYLNKHLKQQSDKLHTYLKRHIGDLHKKLEALRTGSFTDLGVFVAGELHEAMLKVQQGINALDNRYGGEIVEKLKPILESSNEFNVKFPKIQRVLDQSIEQVQVQIENFGQLNNVDSIAGTRSKGINLLKAFGESTHPFQPLIQYFGELDSKVMAPLSLAMQGLGDGFGSSATSSTKYEMSGIIKSAGTALGMLKNIRNTAPSFETIRIKLESVLGGAATITEDLPSKLEYVTDLDEVIEKIVQQSSDIKNADAHVILADFALIAGAVSEHSKDVVDKVMNAVEKKVKEEIKAVAEVIEGMVRIIHTGVKHEKSDEDVAYGSGVIGIAELKAAGLKKMVTDFEQRIRGRLTLLEQTVGTSTEDGKGTNVYADVKKLKGDIAQLGQRVADVKEKVEAVSVELYNCISQTDGLRDSAAKVTEVCFMQLRDAMNATVNDSIDTMQQRAKDLYTARKQNEIAALQKIVQTHFGDIKKIIDDETNSNLKGFLRKWNRYFIIHIDDYASRLSPPAHKVPASQPLPAEHKTLEAFAASVSLRFTEFIVELRTQDDFKKINSVFEPYRLSLKRTLDELSSSRHFDHTFHTNLNDLQNALDNFAPKNFGDLDSPLLAPLKAGLSNFAQQLGHAYVNRYSGQKIIKLTEEKTKEVEQDGVKKTIKFDDLTPEGRNCAKVCLTIVEMVSEEFENLRTKYSSWYGEPIHLGQVKNSQKGKYMIKNPLGNFFSERGYRVASDEDMQDGELQNDKTKMNGKQINTICYNKIKVTEGPTKEFLRIYFPGIGDNVNLKDLIDVLFTMIVNYRKVCHLRHIPGAKPPSNVNQMLHWLIGLEYNRMNNQLLAYFRTFFNAFLTEHKIESVDLRVALPARRSTRMIRDLNVDELLTIFNSLTLRAYKTLLSILGHVQEYGRYACDFYTNPDDLLYPTRDSECFDLLVEICLRLNQQLRFLYKQCQNGPDCAGWRECHYGKGVSGSSWQCNDDQCANQECNQTVNQIHNQTDDQHPKCGIKSPLQSFLEDGLPGFLPHLSSSPGCKLICSQPNHFGKPCKTPMGFRDLSITASHRQTGLRLRNVLENLCGPSDPSLSLICSYFTFLQRRPPTTLSDMFAFYYNFLDNWSGGCNGIVEVNKNKKAAFDEAVRNANFGDAQTSLALETIQVTSKHVGDIANQPGSQQGASPSNQKNNHETGDLFSLLTCNPEEAPVHPCGRYLQSLDEDSRLMYFSKHANVYLSWVVYITETFYALLYDLYNKCNKCCGSRGAKCYGSICNKECNMENSSEQSSSKQVKSTEHKSECRSIVNCLDTHPTIFAASFTFGSPYKLSGAPNYQQHKRTCQDFCEALNKVVKDGSVLYDLVNKHIPNFLWAIREKFFWTTVALWSASFLYLLYVYIGRLDLLHIKSHLHSPSSHRIAAQSLLAAGRVNKLNRVFYLQP